MGKSEAILDFSALVRRPIYVAFSYTCSFRIHTDAMNNRCNDKDVRRKTSLTNYVYLSLYCKGSKRVTQSLRVRGSWRPNINCNILTPILMAVNAVSFSFSWCSTGGPVVHSAGCWLSLLHLISIFSGPELNQAIRAPSAGCGFPYHISSISVSNSNSTATVTRTQLSYIIVQRPLDRPLDLWNRMFNSHQAEILVSSEVILFRFLSLWEYHGIF